MKEITKEMIDIWEMSNMDWMGYTLEKKEHFSYHHLIIPKRCGGKETIENGAILIQSAGHDYLHVIERIERKVFEDITWVLREINEQRYMPTKEQLARINHILKYFEEKYQGETTSKGKPLIRQRFLRRVNYYE
jgi:hypothetical protein